MAFYKQELTDWAIDKIKKEYSDDIALLIGHSHWNIPIDGDEVSFNFFIPATDRGYELAKTFIIDEIGYDLFPMSWERVEGLSMVNESLTTCLADGVILYAKDDEVREQFEDLRKTLMASLSDGGFCYQKCLDKLTVVMELYKNMMFETEIGKVRKACGYIMDFIGQGIATLNGTYLKSGPENLIKSVINLEKYPSGFEKLCDALIFADSLDDLKAASHELILAFRAFVETEKPSVEKAETKDKLHELTGWYEEGRYTFRRIYYYCDQNDVSNTFAWVYNFQQEFDYLETELGLDSMDMTGVFDATDLQGFKMKVKEIEDYIRGVINEHGLKLDEYDTLEAFLNNNK